MARKTSDFLKGWGKASEVFKAIVDTVLSLGGDDGDVGRVLTDRSLRIQIAKLIVGVKRVLEFLDRTVTVTMDLSRTMTQLIANGSYGWINSDVTKHFSIATESGTRVTEIHLLHYNKTTTSDQVLADMDRQGLRPATFRELLWIGIQHPSLQLEFPIIALGTVVEVIGCRGVACLRRGDRERGLGLGWFGGGWGGRYRFAAVRK